MNRRNKSIIAGAAGVALVLGIGGTALAMNRDAEPEVSPVVAAAVPVITETELWGTTMQMPDNMTAFFISPWNFEAISDGQRMPAASVIDYTEDQLAQIEQQLQAAPEASVLFVDDRSIEEAGLTTALSTVTPSNGLTLGYTNEDITRFMEGQFEGQEGTHGNLSVPATPHASFTFTQMSDKVEWQVTEHLVQYPDAMVSVRFTTEGEHAAEFTTEFNNFLSTWTRG